MTHNRGFLGAGAAIVVALTVSCANGTLPGLGNPLPDAGPDNGATDAGNDGAVVSIPLPPVPTDRRDRVGVYAWGFDDSAYPGTPDRLSWATSKVTALGGRTVRVALDPRDPYKVNPPGAFDLVSTVQTGAYDAIFRDPKIQTYLLTTYTASDEKNEWSDGYSKEESIAERAAIASLARYLLFHYEGKTFVILNWEGDNAIAPFSSSAVAWQGYADWIAARAQGVADARSDTKSTSRIFSALEFNLVRSLDGGKACGKDGTRCIVSDVAPTAPVDLYSYSSYQSIAATVATGDLGKQLPSDLDAALALVREKRPDAAPGWFLVGEFGFAREDPTFGECAVALRSAEVIKAAETWGSRYAVLWQVIDTKFAAGGSPFVGFGLLRSDGTQTLTAKMIGTAFSGGAIPSPSAICPKIKAGGVVNGTTFTPLMHRGETLSIFGDSFAASGNVVHVWEGDHRVTVATGSTYWYESPTQINFTLPTSIGAASNVLVYVTSGDGVDSNGQLLTISP